MKPCINKQLLLLLVLSLLSAIVHAQQSIRLNNNWEFLKSDLGGIWEAVRPVKKGEPEEVPRWTKVLLPHCVNAQDAVDPDVHYYQGPSWYRTQLAINNPYQNGRTLLHFEGAGQKTDVYVYTTKVGSHVGGYDEFSIDITDAITAFQKTSVCKTQFNGNIPIAIRTDNSRDLELIPSNLSDFNVYGGLYRYLNLVYTPALSLDKVFAHTETSADGKTSHLQVNARCYNPLGIAEATMLVRVLDPERKELQRAEKKLTNLTGDIPVAGLTIPAPRLWSTATPVLYTVETTITAGGDTFTQRDKVGFRRVEFVKKGPFLLNGSRLVLHGTHRHEDHAGVGAAMTETMMRQEMIAMKEMGVNFIRLGHYQQSRYILHLCDSLGILVWEEIPWCRGGLGGDVYKEQATRMLTNMIEQHYNHAAVIIWGLGNENDWPGDQSTFDKEKIRAFMTTLNALSHRLDSSRKTAIRRCDFCKDIVDVYSPSVWAGWYRGNYTEYKEVMKAEFEKVDYLLHMEWGGDSHARRHSEEPDKALLQIGKAGAADERAGDASLYGGSARVSKDGDWSESYACNLMDWHLKEQETMPWLAGAAQWAFKDFSTPIRPDNPVPYVNQKGVVERDLTKKETYYVFQSYWANKPMVHIYGHSMPVRWGREGEEKMIKVYSNCEEATLFVNGQPAGTRKRNPQDFPAAGLRWQVQLKKGKNTIRVIARKGNIQVEDQISYEYQTSQWGQPAKLQIRKVKEQDGVVVLQATLLDAKGVQCLNAANWIRFGITGEGALVDNLGTSSGSRLVQLCNGAATIKVKTNQGQSVVSATVETVPVTFIELR